jgi:8-oxo-dGTP diphosphatase
MVMIEDRKNNKVLVQDRIKSYKGYSFPGGHVKEMKAFTTVPCGK